MKNFNANAKTKTSRRFGLQQMMLLLLLILALLFWRSFLADYVHFSNDGPLGQQNVNWLKLPSAFFGMWDDLNDVGYYVGAFSIGVTPLIKWLLGPVGYAKFYAPIALFILGMGAWTFFRSLKLSSLATALGALAVMLSSSFFSGACWGVAAVEIAMGFNLFALALVMANDNEPPLWYLRGTRLVLAGFCVGINIIEAADVGALCSLLIAGFVFFKSLTDTKKAIAGKVLRGISHVAIIAVFAGFIAVQTLISLVGTSVTGIAGTAQDEKTRAAHWDFATQWSLPKTETLGLVVPGLFGYKMDTPMDMMPALQDAYQGGLYWGGIGRDPANDRFYDGGGQGSPPDPQWMRQTGSGYYCGILVVLIAAWAVAQSFRRQNSLFDSAQKKLIWFWTGISVVSLLLAWGRFAPMFYGLLYQLPYFSTIRNPDKFLFFVSMALAILFAYGVHALSRRYLEPTAAKSSDLTAQLQAWWKRATSFDRRWTWVCLGLFGASGFGGLIYYSEKPSLIQFLQNRGFPDEAMATKIATFSIGQVGWFIMLFAVALALLLLILAGYFSGPRAKLGAVLLGAFLIFDLGRADLPYIIHWNYKQKYEVGSLNPIVKFLSEKPYEHRVVGLPFDSRQQLRGYDNFFGGSGIYRIEWTQHHFPYYNIQCLDLIQMSRMPDDMKTYLAALSPDGTAATLPLLARHWELSNTRYILGAAGFLDVMNEQLDPAQHRFRIAQRFDLVAKPGVTQPSQLEDLTAMPSSDGDLALFEFTGALPRVKLYSNWQVNTNDAAVLKTLADLNFDPAKTVLVDTPEKDLPAVATNENSGTVEFQSYAPKKIVFNAAVAAPSVLLLNDKYDPHWSVTVDGKPAQLLRCNFLMRGVYLMPGTHIVEFKFSLSNKPLYITLAAMFVGILLGGFLFLKGRCSAKNAA